MSSTDRTLKLLQASVEMFEKDEQIATLKAQLAERDKRIAALEGQSRRTALPFRRDQTTSTPTT